MDYPARMTQVGGALWHPKRITPDGQRCSECGLCPVQAVERGDCPDKPDGHGMVPLFYRRSGQELELTVLDGLDKCDILICISGLIESNASGHAVDLDPL